MTPKTVCLATSQEANFDSGTWTFKPFVNFAVGAGRYAIMRESDFTDLVENAELPKIFDTFKTYFADAQSWQDIFNEIESMDMRLQGIAMASGSPAP